MGQSKCEHLYADLCPIPTVSCHSHTVSSAVCKDEMPETEKYEWSCNSLDHPLGTLDFHFANLAHRVKCKWVVATCHSFLGWDEAHHSVHCKNSGKLLFSGFHFCEIPLYSITEKLVLEPGHFGGHHSSSCCNAKHFRGPISESSSLNTGNWSTPRSLVKEQLTST